MALAQPYSDPKHGRPEPEAYHRVERVTLEPLRPYAEVRVVGYQSAEHAAVAGAKPLYTLEIAVVDTPERTDVGYITQDVDGVPTQMPVDVVTPAKLDYTRFFGTAALAVKDANPIERAYAALKERPEFAGAVDVLEEPAALRG